MTIKAEYGIIGAGISGLIAAKYLQSAGRPAVIVEKARGVGGRMATRRRNDAVWDHGAQYVRFNDPQAFTDFPDWRKTALEPWFEQVIDPEGLVGPIDTRWKGKAGMTSLAKELARDLEIRLSTRITTIEERDAHWQLQAESGENFQFEKLLITSPVPQSLALIENLPVITPKLKERLQAIDYAPCLALLVSPTTPSILPAPGVLSLQDHPILFWIADNQQKGISSLPSITIHAQGEWSKAHFEVNEADIVHALMSAARPYLGEMDILDSQLMRWRYSQPVQETVSEGSDTLYCQVSEQPLLLLSGDAFGGSRVEGAMRSGLAAAQRLLGA